MTAIPPPALDPLPAAPGAELLRRLTASLAHNVNNALTGVIGYLEVAVGHAERPEEAATFVRSGLHCAYEAADAVRRIVGCSRRIGRAEAPASHPLRRLAQEAAARTGAAMAAGPCTAEVYVSAELVGLALDALARVVAGGGCAVTLRAADEDGRCAVYVEGAAAAPDLALRLLEASLMTEIQGGALEVLSPPGRPAMVRMSFPAVARAPIRLDAAQSVPPAPHVAGPLGLLRPAG
jgi:hypothetical protein